MIVMDLDEVKIKAIAPPIQLLVISGAIALMDELCGLNKIKLYK